MSIPTRVPLPETNRDLTALMIYLLSRNLAGPEQAAVIASHSPQQDKFNAKSTRAFCHVTPGDHVIHCTQWVERLPGRNRLGLLLHEIGHLVIHGFKSIDDEVDVDEWILKNIPEAKYRYETVSYDADGESRVAQHLQTVGEDFYERIGSGRRASMG